MTMLGLKARLPIGAPVPQNGGIITNYNPLFGEGFFYFI
jgi:hypothetical protein